VPRSVHNGDHGPMGVLPQLGDQEVSRLANRSDVVGPNSNPLGEQCEPGKYGDHMRERLIGELSSGNGS